MNSKNQNKKSYALNRIYPDLLNKDPKKWLARLGIAYLGFLEPIIEIVQIPWEIYNRTKPKDYKDLILFSDTQITAQIEDQPLSYDYAAIKNLKIYFNNNSNDFHEEGSTLNHSNIHFEFEGVTTQFYFDNRETELIKLLKFLYGQEIKFKEYRNGQRTFLLKQPKYKELQELKKRYNLEW